MPIATGSGKKESVTARSAKDVAMGLLARREHSASELKRKLQQKGCAADEIVSGLSQLQADGALSDRRFTEAYVHMRKNKGYGPVRIMAELREKGVSAELANEYLYQDVLDWQAILRQQYLKKYSGEPLTDYHEKSKRIGYLQTRGFKLEWIFELFDE
ncbi:MAG: regulatory protein [Pseudomonadota bacterium]|nr:regulatory protein [Pseudomonadota bacterium]